jgi:5-methylcytosine-specific restriction endonuclease McrA
MARTRILPYVLAQVKEKNIKKYVILTCEICKEPIDNNSFHIDHKIPVSKFARELTPFRKNGIGNLQITCPKCNLVKSNKLIKFTFKTL